MQIIYIGKHEQANSADDEGAVHHALESLGHRVERVRECNGQRAYRLIGDFALFHHWHDFDSLRLIKVPKVFWCFDLVDWPGDPTLAARNAQRRAWVEEATKICTLGFMTDGDWVAKDKTGKLRWLPQGADQRYLGIGTDRRCPTCKACWPPPPILFTGISKGGGMSRVDFVEHMRNRWGDQFNHVKSGIYGTELRDTIHSSAIVVAPDSPVTNKYWSNRVWHSLGYGAFMLHPYSDGIAAMYRDNQEIVFYRSRNQLDDLIEYYLKDYKYIERNLVSKNALEKTRLCHTYQHRVGQLIDIVKGTL